MDLIVLAQRNDRLNEFLSDPMLTVACVMLIVVSLMWVVVSRLIARNLRKAALRGIRNRRVDSMRPTRDIWTMPPRSPTRDSKDPPAQVVRVVPVVKARRWGSASDRPWV